MVPTNPSGRLAVMVPTNPSGRLAVMVPTNLSGRLAVVVLIGPSGRLAVMVPANPSGRLAVMVPTNSSGRLAVMVPANPSGQLAVMVPTNPSGQLALIVSICLYVIHRLPNHGTPVFPAWHGSHVACPVLSSVKTIGCSHRTGHGLIVLNHRLTAARIVYSVLRCQTRPGSIRCHAMVSMVRAVSWQLAVRD
ncbi:hypothetical protein RRG08_060142 [Elysia crispata]|uniref:Uncharacterized protein n=1 Tax=Elysia crispata TaxID=231223 RepID=A0AAE1DQ75_9GAST|nr:hypothetical protein RRG08_060142 [Elysia crispata]